ETIEQRRRARVHHAREDAQALASLDASADRVVTRVRHAYQQSPEQCGKNGRWRMRTTAMRPAMRIESASTNCSLPVTVRPAPFFSTMGVSGQAAKPENIATHPFVMGHGPWCTSSTRPPTPASPVHPHATIQTNSRANVRTPHYARVTAPAVTDADGGAT